MSEATLNKAAQLDVYQTHFKEQDILVDGTLYVYLKQHGYLEAAEINAESLLIQCLTEQIKSNELALGENLSDPQVAIFVDSLYQLLKQENWIEAALSLHTYIDLLSQQLFREFTPKDKERLESFTTRAPKAQFAKRDRMLLANNLKGLEEYQASMTSEETDALIPLVFVQIACSTYDSFPSKVSRNSLVHFNSNVAFNEIDQLYVFKHIQIAKSLEQQLPLNKQFIFEVLEGLHQD